MRKPKVPKAPKQPKAPKVHHTIIGEGTVPCVRVGFGAQAARGPAPAGCTVVQHLARPTSKFALRPEYKTTTASVRTPKANPPCRDSTKRKTCPVQLAYDEGQPFLRFCHTANRKGYRVDVASPKDALEKGRAICADWAANNRLFEFPEGQALKGPDLGQPRRK
jgi:hypothetical protein